MKHELGLDRIHFKIFRQNKDQHLYKCILNLMHCLLIHSFVIIAGLDVSFILNPKSIIKKRIQINDCMVDICYVFTYIIESYL